MQGKWQALERDTRALSPSSPSLLCLLGLTLKAHRCSKWNPASDPMLMLIFWWGTVFRAWNRPNAHLPGPLWQGEKGCNWGFWRRVKLYRQKAQCEVLKLFALHCLAERGALTGMLQIRLCKKRTWGFSCADWSNLNENHQCSSWWEKFSASPMKCRPFSGPGRKWVGLLWKVM